MEERVDSRDLDAAVSAWHEENLIQCPSCQSKVRRSGGCNYVRCICGTEFCSICLCPWDQHCSMHENRSVYFYCHVADHGTRREIKTIDAHFHLMDETLKGFASHWYNHSNRLAQSYISTRLGAFFDVDPQHESFVLQATSVCLDARRVLQCCYIQRYFSHPRTWDEPQSNQIGELEVLVSRLEALMGTSHIRCKQSAACFIEEQLRGQDLRPPIYHALAIVHEFKNAKRLELSAQLRTQQVVDICLAGVRSDPRFSRRSPNKRRSNSSCEVM